MDKRMEYWNHFVEQSYVQGIGGGHRVTGPRLRKIKNKVLHDKQFWFDIIDRHNGSNRTPEQMKAQNLENYNHCLGNFWGMVIEILDHHSR